MQVQWNDQAMVGLVQRLLKYVLQSAKSIRVALRSCTTMTFSNQNSTMDVAIIEAGLAVRFASNNPPSNVLTSS